MWHFSIPIVFWDSQPTSFSVIWTYMPINYLMGTNISKGYNVNQKGYIFMELYIRNIFYLDTEIGGTGFVLTRTNDWFESYRHSNTLFPPAPCDCCILLI